MFFSWSSLIRVRSQDDLLSFLARLFLFSGTRAKICLRVIIFLFPFLLPSPYVSTVLQSLMNVPRYNPVFKINTSSVKLGQTLKARLRSSGLSCASYRSPAWQLPHYIKWMFCLFPFIATIVLDYFLKICLRLVAIRLSEQIMKTYTSSTLEKCTCAHMQGQVLIISWVCGFSVNHIHHGLWAALLYPWHLAQSLEP